jgi:precorrin isomerase
MVDGVLQGPGATPPAEWRDARLRTPAGMLALRRATGGIAVVVFGNADAALQAMQRRVADTLRQLP